ncbi:MAG: peroxide stress protein YaaA [Lawsonella clevelandensis]
MVDCRSGAYQKAWMPNARVCQEHAIDLVQVKVVRLTSGREKVVSHNAKQWRGLLTQALVRAGATGSPSTTRAILWRRSRNSSPPSATA